MQVHSRVHFPLADADILRIFSGIVGVGIDFRGIFSAPEKSERNIELAGAPIGHAAEIPILSIPARDRDVFSRFAVQHLGLIPGRGTVFDEVEGRLVLVILRRIGNHLERRLVHRIHPAAELVFPSPWDAVRAPQTHPE